jgi:DNA-directed RNA polymerase specialized sigma24 family protein
MVAWQTGTAQQARPEGNEIRSAQLGDRDMFVKAISGYDSAVFRLAWSFTQSASDAMQIYETTFTTAYRLMPSYNNDSFLIWVFRIATQCCLAYASGPRRASSWESAQGPGDARIPARLRQAVMQLSARDRLVFVLRHELQFKTATIARMLSTDEHAVQTSLTRAFLMLRNAAKAIGIRQ